MKLKLVIAVICILLSFGIAGFQAFHAHWLSAITTLMLGPTVGLIFLLGFNASRDSLLIQVLAGLTGAFGLVVVFFEHRAFDVRRIEAHGSVLSAFAKMELACPVMDASLRAIQHKGIMACSLQDNSDQISAVAELQKARMLGPTMSLTDTVYSATQPSETDYCAEALRAAQPRCPDAFGDVPKSSQDLLLTPN